MAVLVSKRISVTVDWFRNGSVRLSLCAAAKDKMDDTALLVLRVQYHECAPVLDGMTVYEATLCASASDQARRTLLLLEQVRLCNTTMICRSCPNADREASVLRGLEKKGFLGSAGCLCRQQQWYMFEACSKCKVKSSAEEITVWKKVSDSKVGQLYSAGSHSAGIACGGS